MAINSYRELIVWQRAMELVHEVYALCKQLPARENFILVSQMLRAVISIPSNIAEGFARNRRLEFIHFLEIAFASSCELETQISIAEKEYDNLRTEKVNPLICEIQKMLRSLISSISKYQGLRTKH